MKYIFGLLFFMTRLISGAQTSHFHKNTDTTGFLHQLFEEGHTHMHLRSFSMATINQGGLRDYRTNAIGGSLGFYTGSFKGISFGVKGIFTYNLADNELNRTCSLVGKPARWELELYDINRPERKSDLDRLEELFVQFEIHGLSLKLGKIDINKGPLFLNRDGRMKAFVYRGIYGSYTLTPQHRLFSLLVNGVSPRGMTEWYSLNEAIGIVSNGFTADGTKASYRHSLNTKGIAALGWESSGKGLETKVWNYHFHNIMNTLWAQTDLKYKDWRLGVQLVGQHPLNYQSRLPAEKQYISPGERSWVFASQLGHYCSEMLTLSAAYLRSSAKGRFLFPRELGREDFYVSQPRSWVDGFGDLNVFQIQAKGRLNKQLHYRFLLSYWDAPDIQQYHLNKYGKPGYLQNTSSLSYHFPKKLKGVTATFLYVGKASFGQELSPSETFYRTNLHHFNFILNYELTI